MARFGAKFGQYRHGIRDERTMVLADGQRQELTKGLTAAFRQGILTSEEVERVAKTLTHHGLPIDRDSEEHFSPNHRISGFDSVEAQGYFGWTDEERELVEAKLRLSQHNGSEFIELTDQPAEKPWPGYDALSNAGEIVKLANAIGVSLEAVLAYEAQNENRPEVLETIEAARSFEEKDQVVQIEA